MLRFALAIGIAIGSISLAHSDEKAIVARTFHADPQYLVMNLPPRPDAWPGAIFTANLRIPIVHGDPNDPALHRGEPVAISTTDGFDLAAGADAGVSSWFGVSAEAGQVADIVMSFPDAQIVDMNLDDLKNKIQGSAETVDTARNGQIPVIVVKSYSGTPVVTITRKDTASAEAWARLKENISIGANALTSSDKSISYKAGEKFVFAFETAQITFNPNSLNKGPLIMQLSALPANLYNAREDKYVTALAEVISKSTGISVKEIKDNGFLGGSASLIKKPFSLY
jgi:hypothetical protein